MSSVEEIKRAISELPKEDFWKLSEWVIKRHEDEWDRKIDEDIRGGKLDRYAAEALREEREGKTSPELVFDRINRINRILKNPDAG